MRHEEQDKAVGGAIKDEATVDVVATWGAINAVMTQGAQLASLQWGEAEDTGSAINTANVVAPQETLSMLLRPGKTPQSATLDEDNKNKENFVRIETVLK